MDGWSPQKAAAFKASYLAFLKHCKINSKDSGKITLGTRIYMAQRMAIDQIFEGLGLGIHDFKILKSRQLGISTITRTLIVFWAGMHEGYPGSLVFDTDANREKARREIESLIADLPARLKFPKVVLKNRYQLTLENGSTIEFKSAGVRAGKASGTLGRSSGLAGAWCSEMCSWDNPEGIKSFKQSLSEIHPDRLYIWESTARGFNEWHAMCMEAKADTMNQRLIFIGWWAKETQRLERGTAAFEHYGKAPLDEKERERVALVLELYGVEVTIEQVAWYRRKTDPTAEREEGDEEDAVLLQEQPWTEDEAWQMSGSSFFRAQDLQVTTAKALQEKFKGYRFYPGTDFITCNIQPARTYRDVNLKIWEDPVPGATYVVSGDPAFGHDENNDRSALEVFRCYADGMDQVAEAASASWPTNHFAWLIAAMVGHYMNCHLIIEINGPGEAVWNEYKSLRAIVTNGYLRAPAREKGLGDIFTNVRNYMYARSDAVTGGHNYHWKTQTQLKIAIMERFRDFHATGEVNLRSFETLEEMKSVTRDGDSISAQGRNKDDRVMACAMATRCWEDRVRRSLIGNNQTRAAEVARLAASPRSRYELFTKHTIETFFTKKAHARTLASMEARRRAWRGR